MEKNIDNSSLIEIKPIGIIKTPYKRKAPYQPVQEEEEFYLEIFPEYMDGLKELETFRYIYVIFYMDRAKGPKLIVEPPWAGGIKVGLFASRSPNRPNPIGISVVKVKKIAKNRVYISSMDALDGTPLIDIKPYIKHLDSKDDANLGWVENIEDKEHLILHLKGIPHDY
ncbi:MAG: tRNA (N6-threonylcarbamoyladenosine(37)-N6)-methyltransferase TrmO [Candidatus Aminicenantes bacterium]|nr:tRNA (N6-threonylcarbamoyladenosine(37)-N6)-methyltransferase TrmO [Candidatus Aminicenantes bacterium]